MAPSTKKENMEYKEVKEMLFGHVRVVGKVPDCYVTLKEAERHYQLKIKVKIYVGLDCAIKCWFQNLGRRGQGSTYCYHLFLGLPSLWSAR